MWLKDCRRVWRKKKQAPIAAGEKVVKVENNEVGHFTVIRASLMSKHTQSHRETWRQRQGNERERIYLVPSFLFGGRRRWVN